MGMPLLMSLQISTIKLTAKQAAWIPTSGAQIGNAIHQGRLQKRGK
jgi:hypothetical protein